MDHLELWKAIKQALHNHVAEGFTFNNFVEPLRAMTATENGETSVSLYLTTSVESVAQAWQGADSEYYQAFVAAAMEATMTTYGKPTFVIPMVTYVPATQLPPEPVIETPAAQASDDDINILPKLNPEFRFDTFVSSDGNLEAYSVAQAVAADPGRQWNPLMIYGGVGLGKTHLMQAIGNEVLSNNPNAKIMYITTEDFTNDWTEALRTSREQVAKFKAKYRSLDLLLVDDIQFLEGKQQFQEEFFNTFNALTSANHQVVMTSDRLPKDIPTLEARLVSRFNMGYPANITKPDLQTRVAILRNKADQEQLDIPNDVIDEIADAVDTNVRDLEGVFNSVVARVRFSPAPVTVETTREILENLDFKRKRQITIGLIQEQVAQHYQITVDDLNGKKRNKEIVMPRQIAMYLAREMTQESLPQIGRAFGGKDHTTVMHASEKIVNALAEDADLAREVSLIRDSISD